MQHLYPQKNQKKLKLTMCMKQDYAAYPMLFNAPLCYCSCLGRGRGYVSIARIANKGETKTIAMTSI
jgi:hypothetical protein